MNLYSPVISGSLTVTGSTSFIGNVTMTGTVSATASNATLLNGTGSVGFATTSSFTATSGSVSSRITQIETVYATTGSNSFRATQSITGSLTVTGQITAQTLNVQQVTSSIVYSSGSNVFGCDINSRQTFTGSFYQTGSVAVFNSNVGVGTINPGYQLEIVNPSSDPSAGLFRCSNGVGVGIGRFYSSGLDSANTKIIYSYLQTAIEACGATSYCSRIEMFTACNGALTRGFMLNGIGVGCFASTVCSSNALIVSKNGSDTIGAGAFISLQSATGTNYQQNLQLGANGSLDFWNYDSTSWNKRLTIASTGIATFSCQVNAESFYTNDTRYIANQIMSGYNTNSEDSDIWINYTGYQGGTTRFRDFRVGNGKQGQIAFFDGSTGRIEFACSIRTNSRLGVGISTDETYASIFIGGDITSGANQYALILDPQLSGTNSYGLFANARIKASTAVTNTFGVYIPSAEKLSGASIANNYALYIANQTSGASVNYSIYSSGGLNYFGGNVSIGTTCAAFGRALTAYSDVVAYFSSQESITMGISSGTGAQTWGIQVCDTGDGGSALHLNARGGNVGINIGAGNAASYPLHVNGTAYATGAAGALSDCRRKQCIQSLSKGLSEVMRLNPVEFEWKNQYINDCGMAGTQLGFIAQEVREILPSSILVDSLNDNTLALKINEFIPILTKAIQEQQCTINLLKTCIGIS